MGGAPPGFQQPGQYNPGMQQPYPGGGPMMQQPGGFPGMGGMPGMMQGGPPKQFMITLLLCVFGGYFGAHRFYSGHILFGIIQFLTGGGCGIWWAIDLFLIVTGKYTDSQGRPLAKG
jgi:TM2 domain